MFNGLHNGPIFICACEPSGDLYASFFVRGHIPKKGVSVYGVGGNELRDSGVELLYDYRYLRTFGFTSGLLSAIKNYRMYQKIARAISRIKPKTFIAVAYPGLNLLLCRQAKKMGIRVLYLLPPQIWAWGEFRKYFIKRWVDSVISFFPFEYNFYKHKNIRAVYLSNPLNKVLKKFKKKDYERKIAFMPGSRINEIRRNLPIITGIIKGLKASFKFKDFQFMLILHPDFSIDGSISRILKNLPAIEVVYKNRYQAMHDADFLVITSGTASLEASIMGIPQIFFNRPAFIDYHIFRHFLKIKEYNLANLCLEKRVIPSFVMRDEKALVEKIIGLLYKYLVEEKDKNEHYN